MIDECHRGSADDDAAWREILDYFSGATQIGLTATSKETEYASNIAYFGEPVYSQGNAAFARTDRLEADSTRALLDRLEAAILARPFHGELVSQGPIDAPAAALLAQIRAQREAAPKVTRERRAGAN